MTKIASIKSQFPELQSLSDDQIVNVMHSQYYPDRSRDEVADAMGIKLAPPAPAEPESRGVAGWAKDGGISLLKGAIALPESFVGMADIATGGRVGKALEGVGYEPSRARAILDEYLTDNQKAANAEFQKAEGIPGKFAAAIQNPSVIGQAVIESAPSMLGGAGVARGLLGVAPKMGAVAAGALGEGIVGAGQAAEQIRTQTPDRLLSTDQSMSALASGAGTAVFGALGGKISQRLGIGDVDTMLAQAAVNPVARKGVVRAAIEGFISEGVLEELPQSIQEQVWQNQALGKPLSDGVDEAAVLGLLSGGAMGTVAGPMSSGKAGDPIRDLKTGGTDPLSRAADIGLDAKAKQADVGITEGQYNAAMAAMGGQLSDDQKAIKSQGRADKTGFAGQPIPQAPSMAQAMGLMGDATQEVSAFSDRAMLVKESLADPTTRDFIRQNLGDDALNEAAYYAEQADRPGDIPDKTRENMLALAEAIISRARLTPITQPAGLGSNVGPALDALGAPQAVPAIGLDTTPTGAFRVDAAGNAAPEVRADVINTRQAPARDDTTGQQARKASAVWADPAPKKREAPALGYDVSPTGRMVSGPDGVSVETNAERINRQQARSTQQGDITRANGQPFKNLTAAKTEQRRSGGAVVEVTGGWVVRPQAETINGDTGQTTGRAAGSVGAGSPDAPASPQGAGFSPDVRGGADAGGSGRADGAGVPERNLGSPVAAQPGAARDARSQLKAPAFLRKTLPEMTDTELTQASEFYGADHPRASKVKQEVEKRERKAKFEAKKNPKPEQANEQDAPQTQSAPTQAQPGQKGSDPAGTGTPGAGEAGRVSRAGDGANEARGVKSALPAAKPVTMKAMAQDLAKAIKDGGWAAYTDLRTKLSANNNLSVRQTLDLNNLTRAIVGVEFFNTEYAKADPEKAGRVAHMQDEAPIPPEGLSADQRARWLSGWDEGKAGDDGQEPVSSKTPGEVVGEATEAKDAPKLPAPKRPKARKHPPTVRGSGALADISRALGGLSPDLLSDLSEKVRRTRVSKAGKRTQYTTWDNPAIPGIGPLFRMGGTADLSEVARVLEESGYLEAGAVENNPVGAKQRAEAIIKAELREGGRTLRVGDADAIESEMRGRQEAAMDEMSDPWDDFSFAPEDLDAAGYTDLGEETRAATEQLIAEAEGLGIDTEAIRDDTARIVGDSASQEEYHAATQEAIRQAIAQVGRNAQQTDASGAREGNQGGGSPAEQAGGAGSQGQRDSGSDQEGLSLTAPTRADIEAQQDRAEQADALDEKAQAKRASEIGDSTFMTGFTGDGRQDNTADLFSQAAQPDAEPEPAESQPITEAEARKRLEWRDMGQRDNTKRLQLSFQDADGRPMTYGTLTKDTGAKAWTVADSDGWRHSLLTAAKKKAEDLAILRLKKDGYVKKSALEDALGVERANAPTNGAGALRKQADDLQNEARKMLEGIEPGQPIMSTRDASKRERAREKTLKAGELYKRADELDAQDQQAATGGIAGATAGGSRSAPAVKQAKPSIRIEDIGEKIGGARKDVWTSFKDDLKAVADGDIRNEPLSKVWPAPDYQKLIDGGLGADAVALVRSFRDEIPAKPRAAWKVKRWAEQVKTLREFANDLLSGSSTAEQFRKSAQNLSAVSRGILGRADLYMEVGHAKSLEGISLAHRHYTLYRGRENVSMWVVERDAAATAFSNWPQEIATGDTKAEAIEAFKKKYATLDAEKQVKKASFDIISTGGKFYVAKKIGRNFAKLAGPFATVKEAREHRAGNIDALEKALEAYKEIPRERRDVNDPRVGEDMRNGTDVTPEFFAQTFGFRGVEFGNWVEQGRRQKDLNDAFDALMDMAAVLGLPPKAISLNGELGLAFGARGGGGVGAAAAHYEDSKVVINLTKKEGAGSLGHEWWHAVDNYFSRMRKQPGDMMTTALDVSLSSRGSDFNPRDGVRREMVQAFGQVVGAIKKTAMKARSERLDAKRSKDYWTTGDEMSARAFESYLIAKLQDQEASNDYLANVVDQRTWDAMAALGIENENSYPYPTADEIPAIREGFDRFFQTVQTREDDVGNVGMFSRPPEDESFYRSQVDYEWAPPSVVNRVKQQVESLRTFWKNSPEVVVLASFADAPVEMQKLNDKQVQNGAVGEPEGFFYKGKAYLLAPHMKGPEDVRRVLFHETLGHLGLRGVFGDGLNQILDQLWATRRKDVQAKADAYGLDTSKQGNRRMAAEEVLAEMAQDRPEIGFVRRAVAIVKQWLRKNLPGFAKMKMSDDEIIANFLMPAQRFIERGQGAQGQQLVPAFSRVDEAGSSLGRNMPTTIKVDGKDRPTMNSNGQPVHPTEEGVRNFWKWFGDSRVVDDQGRPLVVYHGTKGDFDKFDLAQFGQTDSGWAGHGFYFTPRQQEASNYAQFINPGKGSPNVMPVYLRAVNPLRWNPAVKEGRAIVDERGLRGAAGFTEWVKESGHDSVNIYIPDTDQVQGENQWVVHSSNQIKSAIGNSGDFNPEDPNIGFSRSAAAADLNTKARNAFSDFVGSAGVQMDWLDKTLKTQYAKAERFPEFKRVFDKLQDYIEGVSSFANQAADKAPDILPKLDSFKDLMREGPESLLRHGLSQEDIKALSAPVFEGTLSWTRDANGELVETQDPAGAGVVFTDAELRDKFGVSKKQIGHYRQFRATVDESLDQVVAADIIKLLGKKAPAGLKALANTADGRARLREALRQTFGNSDDADAKAIWEDQIAPKYDHVASMKAKGYAPLSRFGKFFVHVVDKQTGETAYFGMEETRIMSNQRARDMRGDFGPGFDVTQGTMSQESYKLMSDVPVDAMEMFASAIGAEKSEVFQKYIALAKNNRSTLKRLLKRKGRKGFSLDAPRVLASFVTSNARASAAAVNMMDAKELAQDIQAGDVKDEAIKLIEAVGEPQESGAAVRGLMFANFIGGSIASAVVNMTQPVMMTLPYLSQFGGITKAGKRLVSAAGMAVSGKVSDPEIIEALKRAESEGIVAPQEIHHLLKQATSSAHINPKVDAAIQKLAFVWSTPFALAESFNRKASFIAAYQTAKDEGIANPYAFAQKAVTETQGLYNAGNKPNAARGTLGATVMTFKQYSIHYLEWLARMAKSGPEGKKAALWALALLVMASGSDGLPFSEDLNDVIDTVGQSFGYDTNTKRWRHQVAADALGEEAAEVLSRGLSASAGFPVDVSMRMGMGNLLPATDMLKKSNTDTARSLAELAGPGGALFTQYSDAIKLMLSGEAGAAAMKMTPNALQNLGKAAKMMETGEYRDSKDRKVMDVDGMDAAMKALSFQPAQIARESAKMSENRQSEMLAKAVEGEITDAWARAMVDGDAQAQEDARQRLLDWNKKNPDMPIRINRAQIATKAKKMRQSRAERYIKTVAPERRQAAAKEVES